MRSFDGYKKKNLDNTYVHLTDGSHKPLSDFLMDSDALDIYVKKAGDIMTGDLQMNDMNVGIRWNVNYLHGWDRSFISFRLHIDNDSTKDLETVFTISSYGDDNGYVYSYIGPLGYWKSDTLRFYKNGSICIGDNIVAHAGNIINAAASVGTSLTTIATIAGVNITAKIGDHTHDRIYSLGNYANSDFSKDVPVGVITYKNITSGGTALGDTQYNILHIPYSYGDFGSYLVFGTNNGRFGIKYKHAGTIYEVLTAANSFISKSGTTVNVKILGTDYDVSASNHTHTWASITSKLTDGNAFNFVDNENYSTDIYMNYATSANAVSTKPTLTFHFNTGEKDTSKYANVKAKGFVKSGKTDSEVLLAGGGSKALTDFSMSHSHPYLPTAGGTMTGDVNMDGMDTSINWNVNYLYGWARRFIQFYQHADSDSSKSLEEVFSIGAYGDTVGYVYSWIGTNNYAGANLRFYKDGSITIGDNPVLHAGNYTSYVYSKSTSDGRYVYKSGDTMTGTLSVATKTISYNNSYSTLVALYASLNKGLWDNNYSFWMLASNGTNVFTDKNLDINHVDGININNLMFICVPYTNWGEISLKNNNGFCIGATGGALYVNYSPATKGTTVTKYYWMAGSNTTYSEHTAAKWITAGSSNQYVVLGDGTTKALSDLSNSHEHNYIVSAATVSTIASTDFTSTHFSYNIVTGDSASNLKIDTQVGVISMPWYGGGGGNYGGQLLMGVNYDKIAFRTRYGGTWRAVHELIHSENWSSYITESTLGISGKYLPLTGGTMLGDINFNNMNIGLRYNVDYLGGWARSFLSINSNNGASHSLTELFHIGAYGGGSGYIYTYIGRGDYSSGNNIRFNADNTIYLGDSPSTGTLTANTSLVRTNAVTITSNSSYFTEMYFHNQNVLNFTMRGNWQTLFIGYGGSAISGSYFPTSYVFNAGSSSTYANITAGNFYTSSDKRLKYNIIKISDNIKQFEWKETGETSYGFVAQDLEVKHPELVNDDGNMKTVNYNAALSLVVAKLENRVKELEAKLGIEASSCI